MSDLTIMPDQRLARLNGADLPLGARAFDVLAYLHDHADRVVTKEELLDHVWADRMVEEGNLTVQISALRKALGRRAISTVPGVGYRLTLGATPARETPATPRPPVPDKPSLAVLPFANLTGDPGRDYLVDGIVNEVIAALSRGSAFFVISSTSSFTYKGRTVDVADVGRELGVRYLLEGSIQQAGDQMRISTQLVETETGHTIWHDRFAGSVSDIFELQDRTAEAVAAVLEPKLIYAEAARARKKPTESLAAYDLCLRAAPMVYIQNVREHLEEGLALLNQALELDPDYTFAKALICLAHTGAFATRWWPIEKAQAAVPLAREVLDSRPDDALALGIVGHYIAYLGGDPQRGMTAMTQASRLNPNSFTVAMLKGWVHNYLGEFDTAIEQLNRARRISPLDPQIGVATCGVAQATLMQGDPAGAAALYEQSLTEYPEFASSFLGLICCYWEIGDRARAGVMVDKLRAKVPDMSVSMFQRTRPFIDASYGERMCAALRGLGFPE